MASMNIQTALFMRQWIEDALDDYLEYLDEGGLPILITEVSGDWKSGELVRASSLSKCAKRHAAERAGVIEKRKITKRERYFFRLANAAADETKSALKWAVEQPGQEQWHFAAEARDEAPSLHLAGTPDTMIEATIAGGKTVAIPVEIKKTDVDHFDGLLPDHVWQTIAYMMVAEADENGYDSRFGFVFTMYAGKDDDRATHKVWLVAAVEGGWQVMNGSQPYYFKNQEFPRDIDGANFFPREEAQRMIGEHVSFYNMFIDDPDAAANEAPPMTNPFNWNCGSFKEPEFYKRNYTGKHGESWKKGDRKPGTGMIRRPCPLLAHCWPKMMPERVTLTGKLPDVMFVFQAKDGSLSLDSEGQDG